MDILLLVVFIAAVVFFSFRSKFAKPPEADLEKVGSVVSAYGAFLGNVDVGVHLFRDEKVLPFPKSVIESELLVALSITDDQSMKDHLKVGLLYLPYFQKDVGPEGLHKFGADISKLGDDAVSVINASVNDKHHQARFAELEKKSDAEMKDLLNKISAIESH